MRYLARMTLGLSLVAILVSCDGANDSKPPSEPPPAEPSQHLVVEGQVRVQEDGRFVPVRDTLVYLSDIEPSATPVPTSPKIVVRRQDGRFTPRVVALHVGQELSVEEADAPSLHSDNVQSRNQPESGRASAVSVFGSQIFQRPEVFLRIVCNVHSSEQLYVAVLENPYFVLTDDSGRFRLETTTARNRVTVVAEDIVRRSARHVLEVLNGTDHYACELELVRTPPPSEK